MRLGCIWPPGPLRAAQEKKQGSLRSHKYVQDAKDVKETEPKQVMGRGGGRTLWSICEGAFRGDEVGRGRERRCGS